MTKWNQEALNATLEEALRDGIAVRVPQADEPKDSERLRYALYNRARQRGLLGDLEFVLEERHVIVRRRDLLGMRKVVT